VLLEAFLHRNCGCCWARAQGYQSMAQACGLLQMREARDAWLSSLCAFTLTDAAADADPILVTTRGEGVASPIGLSLICHFPLHRSASCPPLSPPRVSFLYAILAIHGDTVLRKQVATQLQHVSSTTCITWHLRCPASAPACCRWPAHEPALNVTMVVCACAAGRAKLPRVDSGQQLQPGRHAGGGGDGEALLRSARSAGALSYQTLVAACFAAALYVLMIAAVSCCNP
jgi:hypothetical protein